MSNIIADYQTITAWNWRGSSFRQPLNYLCTKQGALICGKFILKSGHTLSFNRSNNASRSNVTFSRTWQTSREYFNRHFQTKISLTYLALCSHLLISQRNSERGDNWRLACAVGGLFSRGTKQQQKPVISLRSRSFRLSSPATQTRNNDVLTVVFKRIWVKYNRFNFFKTTSSVLFQRQ